MIHVTSFTSLQASHGTSARCSAQVLFDRLCRPTECADKRAPGRWGAFLSRDGRRRLQDILQIDALVYDVDEAPVALDALTDALADSYACIYSTWSATPEQPRWRVTIVLDRGITAEEHGRVWRAGAEVIERVAPVAKGAKDACHIWSIPAKRPGGWFASRITEGALFDVGAALERYPEPIKGSSEPLIPTIHSASRYARGALVRAAETIAASQRGERNRVLNAQAFPIGRFVQTGELDEQEVIHVLATAAMQAGMPRREAVYTAGRSIRERLKRVG